MKLITKHNIVKMDTFFVVICSLIFNNVAGSNILQLDDFKWIWCAMIKQWNTHKHINTEL